MILDDISNNKVATQSHTYPGGMYEARFAVDRTTATCMRTEPIGSYFFDSTVWWKVDLGRVYNIYTINIFFRNYEGYGMYLF